jgi:predicted amidohydrolase YtcJ
LSGSAGRLRANSVKIMQDGVLETFTGAMIDSYLGPDGRPTDNRGISFVDPVALREHVTRLDAAGLQVHFHAIGDRAVREALDAIEAARQANGPTDTRPHISHIQVIHPNDVPRFAALDVVANAQPLWACHETQMDTLTIPFLGSERSTWQYPFSSLLRSGARLAMGSDWGVSTPNPLLEIEVAVNRIYPESRDEAVPFLPEERLTLEDAVAAFTLGSAYVNHLDDVTGSIQVGKLADLAVIDRDLFAPDAGPIGDGRVLATFVEGQPVYEADSVGG